MKNLQFNKCESKKKKNRRHPLYTLYTVALDIDRNVHPT